MGDEVRKQLANALMKNMLPAIGNTTFENPNGQIIPGNLELWNRPILKNSDGSVSTTRSFSIGTPLGETLIPQVINGKLLSQQDAINHYYKTGEHLGIFRNASDANSYAIALHNEQEKRLGL